MSEIAGRAYRGKSAGIVIGEKTYSRKHCPASLVDTPDHSTSRFRETVNGGPGGSSPCFAMN